MLPAFPSESYSVFGAKVLYLARIFFYLMQPGSELGNIEEFATTTEPIGTHAWFKQVNRVRVMLSESRCFGHLRRQRKESKVYKTRRHALPPVPVTEHGTKTQFS